MRIRPLLVAAVFSPALLCLPAPSIAAGSELSGKWTLQESSGREPEGAVEVPLEALVDASRIGVEDDGRTVRVTYPSGRRRVFTTDGEERTLDEGDGPAQVRARRKDGKILVSSKWSRERALEETWEVQASPRRLVVTGLVGGRRSYRYGRVYDAAPPDTVIVVATPPPASPLKYATPVAAPASAEAPAPGPAPTPAGWNACTMAKLEEPAAQEKAVAAVAPGKVLSVISSEPDVEEGCLVWPFALKMENGKLLEVAIDAGDGKVIYAGAPRD